jgi:hypothetical protein
VWVGASIDEFLSSSVENKIHEYYFNCTR